MMIWLDCLEKVELSIICAIPSNKEVATDDMIYKYGSIDYVAETVNPI